MVGGARLTRMPISPSGRAALVSQLCPVSMTGLSGPVSPSGRDRGRSLI